MSFASAGVTVGEGPVRQADLDALQQAAVEAVRLRAGVNLVADVDVLRGLGIQRFLVQLLSPRPGAEPISPEAFVEEFASPVAAFLRAGVTDFEIHGEPNTAARLWRLLGFPRRLLRLVRRCGRWPASPLRAAPAGGLPGLAPLALSARPGSRRPR